MTGCDGIYVHVRFPEVSREIYSLLHMDVEFIQTIIHQHTHPQVYHYMYFQP